jgi:hypothetical protein
VGRYAQTDADYAMQVAIRTTDGPSYPLNLLKYRPVTPLQQSGPGHPAPLAEPRVERWEWQN